MKSLIIFLLFFTQVIIADEKKEKYFDDLSLEELMDIKIYSATKSYQRIEEIPANITILTRKDIKRFNYTTLDELLKNVPGLFIIDDTEHFQIGSRGSLGSSFKLMINNNPISPIRIPGGGTSNRNFFATPIEAIDRIEIIKGSQAVTYGSNSMYGSINIITNDFNQKNIFSLGKGNNKQNKLFARANHKQENGGFTLNTSFYNTDGIHGDLKDAFTESYYNSKDASSVKKLDGILDNTYKTLDFSHRYKNLTTDITYSKTDYGFYVEPTYRNGNKVEQIEKALALTYEDEINDKLTYKINFISSIKDYNIDDLAVFSAINYGANNYAKDKRHQLDIHLNYKINKKIKILLGSTIEEINERFNGLFNNFAIKRNYNFMTKDIYSKFSYKLNGNFEFNTGIRYTKRDDFNIHLKRDSDLSNSNYDQVVTNYYDKNSKYLPEISAIYHLN